MYHFLYLTTNKINGKMYIGMHSTDNIDDGYLGSGVRLKSAIQKYGKASFVREILDFFDDRYELIIAERVVVNNSIVTDSMYYNLKHGGCTEYMNSKSSNERRSESLIGHVISKETRDKISKSNKGKHYGSMSDDIKKKISISHKNNFINGTSSNSGEDNPMYGKTHSNITKEKMSDIWQHRDYIECPFCDVKSKSASQMSRWHFNNCKCNPNRVDIDNKSVVHRVDITLDKILKESHKLLLRNKLLRNNLLDVLQCDLSVVKNRISIIGLSSWSDLKSFVMNTKYTQYSKDDIITGNYHV